MLSSGVWYMCPCVCVNVIQWQAPWHHNDITTTLHVPCLASCNSSMGETGLRMPIRPPAKTWSPPARGPRWQGYYSTPSTIQWTTVEAPSFFSISLYRLHKTMCWGTLPKLTNSASIKYKLQSKNRLPSASAHSETVLLAADGWERVDRSATKRKYHGLYSLTAGLSTRLLQGWYNHWRMHNSQPLASNTKSGNHWFSLPIKTVIFFFSGGHRIIMQRVHIHRDWDWYQLVSVYGDIILPAFNAGLGPNP